MIRWICDWLGTAAYEGLENGDWTVIDVRHLVDKAGNRPEALRERIEIAHAHHLKGQRIVVACDFGISRSNAIAAGILSRSEGLSYDVALSRVLEATGETEVKLDVIAAVRAALGDRTGARAGDAILLTGGNGFIGSRLRKMLPAAVAPSRSELDLAQGSLGLARYCEEHSVGQIVHLAYPRHYTNPSAVGESLAMLQAVLSVCKTCGLRLVFISGWVVFSGYATAKLVADETLVPCSKGNYGDAKLLEETLLNFHLARNEVRAVLCRFAPIYGPGGMRPRLIRTFAEAISARNKVVTHRFRNGVPALDLLHVDDAARALAAVIRSDATGVFHFGTGVLTDTPAIARNLATLLDLPIEHEEMAIDDNTSNIAMDSTKALGRFGWQPMIDLTTGLADTLASFHSR